MFWKLGSLDVVCTSQKCEDFNVVGCHSRQFVFVKAKIRLAIDEQYVQDFTSWKGFYQDDLTILVIIRIRIPLFLYRTGQCVKIFCNCISYRKRKSKYVLNRKKVAVTLICSSE